MTGGPSPADGGGTPDRWPQWAALPVIALATLALAMVAWAFVHHASYPYDYLAGEGDTLYSSLRLVRGEDLYSLDTGFPYLYNVYPPIFYWVVAPFAWLLGPELIAQRIVGLLALVGLGWIAARWATAYGAGEALQVAAGAAVASSAALFNWELFCRVDGLSTLCGCGLLFFADGMMRRRITRSGVSALVALSVAACFTKQINVVFVIAAFASLMSRRFWPATVGLLTCGGLCLGLLYAGDSATAGAFWHSVSSTVFWSHRDPAKWMLLGDYLVGQTPWIAATILCLAMGWRLVPIAVWLGLTASAWQAAAITRAGAGPNYFPPLHFFLVVAGAIAATTIGRSFSVREAAAVASMGLQLAVNAGQMFAYTRDIPVWASRNIRALEVFLQGIPGPLLVDRQTELWLRSGKRDHFVEVAGLAVDAQHGTAHLAPLRRFIEGHGFSAIVLRRQSLLPMEIRLAILANYRLLARTPLWDDLYFLYLPQMSASPSPGGQGATDGQPPSRP